MYLLRKSLHLSFLVFFLFLKISFFSLKGERNCCCVVLVLVLVLVLVERNVREEDEEKRASV